MEMPNLAARSNCFNPSSSMQRPMALAASAQLSPAETCARRSNVALALILAPLLAYTTNPKRQARSRGLTPAASHADGTDRSVSQPGVIGGAVIKAARRSARLSRRELARTLGVGVTTVRSWEIGSVPLYCIPYSILMRLSQSLEHACAHGASLTELLLASQCDLLVAAALAGSEDYAEVPPIDSDQSGQKARRLLRWALTGEVPKPYSNFSQRRPLLTEQAALRFLAVADDLARGELGAALMTYGTALRALSERQSASYQAAEEVMSDDQST